jgi:hypothetical protein
MATKTVGTTGTTVLTAVQIPPSYNATPYISDTDWATIQNSILNDGDGSHPILPGAFTRQGLLFLPRNRGVIQLKGGDWVAVDVNGWPVVISNYSLPQTLTATGTHNTTTTITFTSSVLALGWQVGMPLSGTNVGVAAVISAISTDGKTVTASVASTGSGAQTVTVDGGGWTHS